MLKTEKSFIRRLHPPGRHWHSPVPHCSLVHATILSRGGRLATFRGADRPRARGCSCGCQHPLDGRCPAVSRGSVSCRQFVPTSNLLAGRTGAERSQPLTAQLSSPVRSSARLCLPRSTQSRLVMPTASLRRLACHPAVLVDTPLRQLLASQRRHLLCKSVRAPAKVPPSASRVP
eukprot:scaffold6982_cov449-Prasinococcus_capsulatus_cf.AAC.3